MSDDFRSGPGSTLDGVHDWTWSALARGAADRRHPFRTGVLATVGPDGAEARTVVLRHVDRAARTLRFHTDARSPEVRELETEPRLTWLFWHPGRKVQVRVAGRATLHRGDAVARERWDAGHPGARDCYGVPGAPGETLSDDPAPPPHEVPSPPEPEKWFDRFVAVTVEVDRIDWLHLGAGGHLRARFDREPDAASAARWIRP